MIFWTRPLHSVASINNMALYILVMYLSCYSKKPRKSTRSLTCNWIMSDVGLTQPKPLSFKHDCPAVPVTINSSIFHLHLIFQEFSCVQFLNIKCSLWFLVTVVWTLWFTFLWNKTFKRPSNFLKSMLCEMAWPYNSPGLKKVVNI